MGFIAEYDDNWADEMDVYGLRYFNSYEDYLAKFCTKTAYDFIDVEDEDMFEYLGLEYPENCQEADNILLDYFTNHPNEMKERYQKVAKEMGIGENENVENKDSVYIDFIYTALLVRIKHNESYNPWNEEICLYVGTNQEIYMPLDVWFYYIDPDIFAEGELAEQIINGNKHFEKGVFYI